jgi:hypothetical protein
MLRHGQFLQDVEVIEMMYQSLNGLRHDGIPKSPQWLAIMAQGPMDQIRQTQEEMHGHLKLPYPVPAVPFPADADPVPTVANPDDFRLALERLCRLYRALGSLHLELHQFRPRLYASLAERMLPQLYAVQAAMDTYLEWAAVEETSAAMERGFATSPQPDTTALASAPQLTPDKP